MIVKFGFTFAGTKTHSGKLLQNLLEYFSYSVLLTCIAELFSQSIAIAITILFVNIASNFAYMRVLIMQLLP